MKPLDPVPARSSSAPRVYRCLKTRDCVCSVCGKPATGIHYQATSCNGCRSFFRRSVALGRTYVCTRAGSDTKECYMKFDCKHCRFSLCTEAGMSAEAVRKEDNSAEKVNELPEDIPAVPIKSPEQVEEKLDTMIIDLLRIEDAHDRLRISSYSPKHEAGLAIDEFLAGPSKLGLGYEPMRAQPYKPSAIRLVTAEEFIRKKVIIDFTSFDYDTRKLWTFQDPVYSIEFMKALPIYHKLDNCSKRLLLASALACTNFTAAYFSYVNHSDRTYYPDGGTLTWASEMEAYSHGTIRFNTEMIASIREAELDKREYILLKMIIVCNPLLHGLARHDATLLRCERERYATTLMSHVLAKHGLQRGPAIFVKLLSVIDVVSQLTTWQKNQRILLHAMGLRKYRVPLIESLNHSQ